MSGNVPKTDWSDMDSSEVLVQVEENVGWITLNRPRVLNAYTPRMCRELVAAVESLASHDETRVLVITGAGRGFCSGGDIANNEEYESLVAKRGGHASAMRAGFHSVVRAFRLVDKPMIAMINGPAISGGLVLALLCDLRIASSDAVFGDNSVRVGLLPDEGGAWLFPRFLGVERSMRMIGLGEKYSAKQAQEYGLLAEVTSPDELREHTLLIARSLALSAPLALQVAKRMLYRGLESTLESSLFDAEAGVMTVNDSADAKEGMNAFREKRRTVFTGR
jgi:2-(1,2-epoxy-1,2-dihydrophenyl)acetyl-CoA isomerase